VSQFYLLIVLFGSVIVLIAILMKVVLLDIVLLNVVLRIVVLLVITIDCCSAECHTILLLDRVGSSIIRLKSQEQTLQLIHPGDDIINFFHLY
jgi:hypothetical protein